MRLMSEFVLGRDILSYELPFLWTTVEPLARLVRRCATSPATELRRLEKERGLQERQLQQANANDAAARSVGVGSPAATSCAFPVSPSTVDDEQFLDSMEREMGRGIDPTSHSDIEKTLAELCSLAESMGAIDLLASPPVVSSVKEAEAELQRLTSGASSLSRSTPRIAATIDQAPLLVCDHPAHKAALALRTERAEQATAAIEALRLSRLLLGTFLFAVLSRQREEVARLVQGGALPLLREARQVRTMMMLLLVLLLVLLLMLPLPLPLLSLALTRLPAVRGRARRGGRLGRRPGRRASAGAASLDQGSGVRW